MKRKWWLISRRAAIRPRTPSQEGSWWTGHVRETVWSLIFEHGKCYCTKPGNNDKERAETKHVVKDDRVYIAPIVPKGKRMTRNAWPVYTIKGDSLEFSHVEDMDTGEAYKNKAGKAVLVRVRDEKGK